MMFASTALNYMDRQAIAFVGEDIKAEFSINNEGFGWVMAAFQLSYAFFQVPAGYLADRWNVRGTYAGAVAWWSLAGMAAALSPTLGILMLCRALLGIGESFNWPCALRVTGLVLPPQDRSLGNGIFNSGAAVGAVITPLTIPLITYYFGWRVAFLLLGSLGFLWVGVWLFLLGGDRKQVFAGRSKTESSQTSPDDVGYRLSLRAKVSFAGLTLVSLGSLISTFWVGLSAVWWGIAFFMFGLLVLARMLPMRELAGFDLASSLGEIVRLRRFWILVLVSISINVCWHFLVSWLPTYLKTDRGMTYLAGGMAAAFPFLAADFGNLGGGALSRLLAARGLDPARARLFVMLGCGVLISCGATVGLLQSDIQILIILGLMALGAAGFMANYFAFCQEVSARHTGLIVGILGGLGNLLAAGFLPIAGWVKDSTGNFTPVFLVVGLMPFLGLAALSFGWGWGRPATRSD